MDWTKAFAESDTTKIFLDPEQKVWIEVRNELNHDEQRAIALASIRGVSRTTTGVESEKLVEVDLGAGADRKVLTYLVDWNLADSNGKTIDISSSILKKDAIKNLKPPYYKALEKAIDVHVLERASKKTDAWRIRVRSDLILARWQRCSWQDLQKMPEDVVGVLFELFNEDQERIAKINQG
jgi:hypothetical protein